MLGADNTPPTHTDPLILPGSPNNLDDLEAYNQTTVDAEGDKVTNVYNWYHDGQSYTALNLPFDINSPTSANDYSGHGASATVSGATWTTNGVVGGAYSFDGVNDRVTVADYVELDGEGEWSGISVELWFKLSSIQDNSILLSKANAYEVGIKSVGGQNILYWTTWLNYTRQVSGTWYTSFYTFEVRAPDPLSANQWYHLVCTYKSDGYSNIYLNGQSCYVDRISGSFVGNVGQGTKGASNPLYIGGIPTSGSSHIHAVIDGVRIYPDRLDPMQVRQLYFDSKDGGSRSSVIVSTETHVGQTWYCEVTPNDGKADGLTKATPTVTVAQGPQYMTPGPWTYASSTGRAAVIADVVGDEKEEIVQAASHNATHGYVTLYDNSLNIIWRRDVRGVSWYSYPEMADLDNDGTLEILVPIMEFDNAGLHVFNAEDGTDVWRLTGEWGESTSALVVGDIDGDGYPTIFHGTTDIRRYAPWTFQSQVMAIDHLGNILYTAPVWRLCAGGLSLADTDHDGVYELYGGDRSMYYGDGGYGRGLISWWADNLTVRWFDPEILMSSHMPVVADVDKDGVMDIIAAHLRGGILVVDSRDGRPIRKDLNMLQLGVHYQWSVCDIDQDGNLEMLMGDGEHTSTTNDITVWDLYDWKEDYRAYHGPSQYGPNTADVDGDGLPDMIVASEEGVFVYDHNFRLIAEYEGTTGLLSYATVQDIDNDGLNEIVLTGQAGRIYVLETTAPTPSPRPRSEVQQYSEMRQGVAVYLPLATVEEPKVYDPTPMDSATNVPATITELAFKLVDYQHDALNYRVSCTPDIIGGVATAVNVYTGPFTVPVSGVQHKTQYKWWVNVTDGAHWTNASFTFMTGKAGWYNTAWSYRKPITIQSSMVDANLANFPVLVQLTDADLAAKAQSDGDDIVFTDGSSEVLLSHEVEYYSGGELVAWVNVPSVSATADTTIYMYYGNPGAQNMEDPDVVWAGYGMVQHMDAESNKVNDSTANGNDGDVRGAAVTGIDGPILEGIEFDGSTAYVEVPSSSSISGYPDALTLSAWVRIDELTRRQSIIQKYTTAGNQRSWMLEYAIPSTGYPTYYLSFYGSSTGIDSPNWRTQYLPTAETWHYVTVVWQKNQVPVFYVDGQPTATIGSGTLVNLWNNPSTPLHMSRNVYSIDNRFLNGALDEVHVSKTAKTAAWVKAEYMNQHDLGSFAVPGAEQPESSLAQVTHTAPEGGETDIQVSLAELSFYMEDPDGDPIDYIVTTDPGIGSGTGSMVGDGRFTVPVSGLSYGVEYRWTVAAKSGGEWSNHTYTFTTSLTPNHPPTMSKPAIHSSHNLNTTIESLTAESMDLVDVDLDPTTAIYNWYRNGVSVTTLNMPFDTNSGTAKDYSPYSNDGVLKGANWIPDGVAGGAITFDGVNDFVQISDADTIDGGYTWSEATIEFWVKLGKNQRDRTILGKSESYYLGLKSSPDNTFYAGFYQHYEKVYYEVQYSTPLEANKWYHIAVTYQAGNNSAIYINGTEVPVETRDRVYTVAVESGGSIQLTIRNRAGTILVDGKDITSSAQWPDGRKVPGPQVTLEAVPDPAPESVADKWSFNGWSGDVTGATNPVTVTVTGDMATTAEFTPAANIFNSGTNLELGRFISDSKWTYFSGSMDEVRIYPYRLTSEQIMQRYLDTRSGGSASTIAAAETREGQTWYAEVTPNDGETDGETMTTGQLLVLANPGNVAPKISDPVPANGAIEVPVNIYELTFSLSDLNDDIMDYTVTTDPDIGSASGYGVGNGVYTVPVSGLSMGATYMWTIEAMDDTETTTETFTFTTESSTPPVVGWIRAWGYPGGRLDPGGSIARGGKVRVFSQVSDPETASSALTVYLSYRPAGGEWVRMPASYYAASNYWYIDWVIPMDAVPGLYDTRVEVSDGDGGSAELIETGEYEVI